MKTITKSLIAMAAAVSLSACSSKDTLEVSAEPGTLNCSATVSDMMATRSQLTVAEDLLSEASVVVYDAAGNFVKSISTTDMTAISFPLLHIGETYHIYAAFNAGSLTFPLSESDIGTLPFSWDASSVSTKGFPMTWSGSVTLSSDGQNVAMEATRLVSKVRFSVSNSSLSDHSGEFTVSSVALKNSVRTVSIFSASQSLLGEAAYSSDSATPSDITSVNAGNKISFYTFENLGGTLLPGNTDPWNKVPANISGNEDKCTYLEVTGTYSTDGGTATAPVTYRMYLGENATTNFDLVRNYIYDVTLTPSDEGIDRTSWKIERGSFSDSRSLSFTPSSVTMNLNTSATFTVTPTPSGMTYTVTGGSGFGTSTLTLTPTGTPNQYSLVSSGSLSSDAVTSVVATSWDGRVSATLPITVKAKILKHITLTPATVYKSLGETQAYTVTATYDEGGTDVDVDVTSEAEYTVTNPSGTTVATLGTGANKHIATAVGSGTATIKAAFGGKEATAQFNTRYPVSLKVSCPGYQSGTETAPVWKIDWAKVTGSPKTVSYTITVVYNDGYEMANMQASCHYEGETYVEGTAGAGKCFNFEDKIGQIKQVEESDGGNPDTGGRGTVTFSYTEAGRTAGITVEWWKLYVAYIYASWQTEVNGWNLPYGEVRDCYFAGRGYTSVYNDGTYEDPSFTITDAKFTGLALSDATLGTMKPIGTDGFTITALRPGTLVVTGTPVVTHRGAPLKATFYTRRKPLLSSDPNTYSVPYTHCGDYGNMMYLMSEDVDGYHSLPSGHGWLTFSTGSGSVSLLAPADGQDVWNSLKATYPQSGTIRMSIDSDGTWGNGADAGTGCSIDAE